MNSEEPATAEQQGINERQPVPQQRREVRVPSGCWMRWVLVAAGIYNILWGAFIVLLPLEPFHRAGMAPPNYPEIWQCLGMVVGVYGVGYLLAARDPLRHWPIILVGLLGKVLGPIGMLWAIVGRGSLPWIAGWTCVTNDLIWWIPFALILHAAYRSARSTRRQC